MTDAKPTRGGGSSKHGLLVVDGQGSEARFLRGMITHDLIRRGLDFDAAYAVASDVRDHLSGRGRVSTAELRELIDSATRERFGHPVDEPAHAGHSRPEVSVITRGHEQPFSKGLLAETIYAAGVDRGRTYEIVAELEAQLHSERLTLLSSGEIARRVEGLLERRAGPGATRRYRLLRRIHRLPRPVVVYVGGASGTGKSSLALQLAPLLRIYRVIATDTIRQVMRMVFTPSILPSLHRSSFEIDPALAPDPEEAAAGLDRATDTDVLIASYEDQAARVGVGVRAVVERAVAENMSVIVEGVHLRPGTVPFPDLEGACYQIPIILGALDAEDHRARFLSRRPAGERNAARYVRAFEAIRTINDHLLALAEAHDIPLLDTFTDQEPEVRAVQLLIGALERRLPAIAQADWIPSHKEPVLLLVIDGLSDRAVRALGGRTPLAAAATPTLDRLATEGQVGLADPVAAGVVPDTAAGTLALFGQSPVALKRGPVEALGAGIRMKSGDVALRANLATIDDNGNVIDRRAGRIRDESEQLAAALNKIRLPGEMGDRVEVRVRAGTEHRLAILLRGHGLSTEIQGSDPGDAVTRGPALTPRAIDASNPEATFTAAVLAAVETTAREILEQHPVNRARAQRGEPAANAILSRGAGRIHRLVRLEESGLPLALSCIGGDRTLLGLARWLGADLVSGPGMTANLDTDLEAKFAAAREVIGSNDLTILHVKGADIAAHDRRPDLKLRFLERLDRHLATFLQGIDTPIRIAVASDHATLSESGQHAADPVPVLLWGAGIEADPVQSYDEAAAAAGSLGRFPLQTLLSKLYELL